MTTALLAMWLIVGGIYGLVLSVAVRILLHFPSNVPSIIFLALTTLPAFAFWPWWVAALAIGTGIHTLWTRRWHTTVLGAPGEQWCGACQKAMPMDDLIGHQHRQEAR